MGNFESVGIIMQNLEIPYLIKRFFELLGYENLYLEKPYLYKYGLDMLYHKHIESNDKRFPKHFNQKVEKAKFCIWSNNRKMIHIFINFFTNDLLEEFIRDYKTTQFVNLNDENDTAGYSFPADEVELAMLESILQRGEK